MATHPGKASFELFPNLLKFVNTLTETLKGQKAHLTIKLDKKKSKRQKNTFNNYIKPECTFRFVGNRWEPE